MPVTEKIYPDWVQKHRTRGMTVKKKGDSYYLYKRTSKRVPGKKYPQPVDTYVGLITPEGIIETGRKKVTLSNVEVREYGFTKVVQELCPEAWKKAVGANWEDTLNVILLKHSPESYLKDRSDIKKEEDFRVNLYAQSASLSRRLFKKHGKGFNELEPLKTVYLVRIGDKEVVSAVSSAQQRILDELGLKLEV